ncbi:hypothetical protein F5887DRAFT_1282986 [Amanita rubescens]|nr:hypothetical protein F5887DRAFT_1282986 [Amanita rubescens]
MSYKIPTELLGDIFHLLCDEPIALHVLKNDPRCVGFPWAVGQVCSHWRVAFLSNPHIWTSFSLWSGIFRPTYFIEMNQRTAMYLERSGQLPLTITISISSRRSDRFPKTVWKMLLSCMERWKRVNLVVMRSGVVLNDLLRCRGRMWSLESLRISTSTARSNYDAFQVAPLLTELDLACSADAVTWQFPWSQLTKLRIEPNCNYFTQTHNPFGFLSQLQNIEELHVAARGFIPPRAISPIPNSVIRLTRLRFLETSLDFPGIFSLITAPLLDRLHIYRCCPSYGLESFENEFISMIHRSSCHIRQLRLQYLGAAEIFITSKATLTGTEEILITLSSEDLPWLASLNDSTLLPKLRVLQLKCCFHRYEQIHRSMKVISDLLEARGKGSAGARRDIVLLERLTVWLDLPSHTGRTTDAICNDVRLLEVIRGWPSYAEVHIKRSVLTDEEVLEVVHDWPPSAQVYIYGPRLTLSWSGYRKSGCEN